MSENLKNFLRYASENSELQEKLKAVEKDDLDAVIQLASEYGYELNAKDFKEDAQLADEDLQLAAGGYCVVVGFTKGSDGTTDFACYVGGDCGDYWCAFLGYKSEEPTEPTSDPQNCNFLGFD